MQQIIKPQATFLGTKLEGDSIDKITRTIGDLKGIFADEEALKKMDASSKAYDVECYFPVKEGTEGGLFFGITHLYPGLVGNEYFMTKGHFHQTENRGEFYWGIEGEGMLILMNKDREIWAEKMYPGSLHYISGCIGHRVANTGKIVLSFGACWPSDAGHNYDVIQNEGFSKRLLKIDGEPKLV